MLTKCLKELSFLREGAGHESCVLLRLSDLGVRSVTLNRIMREPRSPNSFYFICIMGIVELGEAKESMGT